MNGDLIERKVDRPTRALVTGGMGFIGSHLATALVGKGAVVTVLDDLSTGQFSNVEHLSHEPRFRSVVDSVMNETVLDRLASESDVIFHLAAAVGVELIVNNPVYTVENNVMGTEAVLKAALRYRSKVLIASTSEVYGKGIRVPFAEDDDVVLGPTRQSRWAYSASKMIDEFLALAYFQQRDLPTVVFRLFNTVGPKQSGRYGMVVPRFVQAALDGQPLQVYGDGKQSRCFLHVDDAVQAIISLAEYPDAVGKVFNIGSTEEITILELAGRILELVDPQIGGGPSQSRTSMIPYDQAYGPGFEDMRRRVPDISKIKAAVGWQPERSLDVILRDVIEARRGIPV